jgi:FAD dependent oxidoreductase TIGR03364
MARIVVVGGGIIGTMHAYFALKAGHEVVQVERDHQAQSASVRNFGLIWVSGREVGDELALALRSRELWEEVGTTTGTVGFRANGSLTIATNDAEWQVLQEAAAMPDAQARGFELLNRSETIKLEGALQGQYLGSLRCTQDAAVEPNLLFGGLRHYLLQNPHYEWINNFEVVEMGRSESGHYVVDHLGTQIHGDYLVICAGAAHAGFISEFMDEAPVRKVRLQMAATAVPPYSVGHSIADGDSLRYYPAFKDLSLDRLPAQPAVAAKYKMQLLLVQRFDGSMTIGDTHEYAEPFTHELDEAPYIHLQKVISNIFGSASPTIARRWDGVYSQTTSSDIYFRKEIEPGVVIVTGGGGRGNTLSAAIAEETIKAWKL